MVLTIFDLMNIQKVGIFYVQGQQWKNVGVAFYYISKIVKKNICCFSSKRRSLSLAKSLNVKFHQKSNQKEQPFRHEFNQIFQTIFINFYIFLFQYTAKLEQTEPEPLAPVKEKDETVEYKGDEMGEDILAIKLDDPVANAAASKIQVISQDLFPNCE